MTKSKTILFFGNERVATGVSTDVPVLRSLIEAGYKVGAVIVAQDDLGKSRRRRDLEVAAVANQHGIPVLSPVKLTEAATELKSFNAQAAVLIAYGKIIPQSIIDIFPAGIINIHPSLLPLHRGSIPVESVILDGSTETGVSLMQLSEQMDAGPVFAQEKVKLNGTETKQALADQLIILGKDMLLKCLPQILDGSFKPMPQDNAGATYDNLIEKSNGELDWSKPAVSLEREIRAYAGWPRSRTTLGGVNVIVTAAHAIPSTMPEPPGHIEILIEEKILMISTSDGYLCIDRLIPAGKKEMPIQAFLAGYSVKPS